MKTKPSKPSKWSKDETLIQLQAENQMLRHLNDQLNRTILNACAAYWGEGTHEEISTKMFEILGQNTMVKK